MEFALEEGIFGFTAESVPEIELLSEVASELGKTDPVLLRVNPDVDPRTHAYTTTGKAANKFGIEMDKAPGIARQIQENKNLKFLGFHIHIGSQLTEVEPYRMAVEKALEESS